MIREEITTKKEKLMRYYDWGGRDEEDKMYGYFMRMNRAFEAYYGITLI